MNDAHGLDPREILLVEDNPDDVALTLRAFARSHVANPVRIARDGVEALDFLHGKGAHANRRGHPLPALVLLDLKLPKLDGLEVLRAVRREPSTALVPIVALTSSSEEQDVVQSYALGVNSYIRKPVDFDQFVEAVRQLGLYWLVLNVSPPGSLPKTGDGAR